MRIPGLAAAAAAMAVAIGFGAAATPAQAQAIACGGVYTIQRGDTLATIARRAYGANEYQIIYLANTEVIGPDPNLVEVGMRLRIPCLGDPAAAQQGGAARAAAVTPPEPVRPGAAEAVRYIGVHGAAPFSDEGLPGGGLFTEMMRLALQRSGAPAPSAVDFAPDWSSQLGALLPGGGYDVGFPWVRPDCARPGTLGAESRARCRSFTFSDPFFEVVLSFYTLKASEYAGARDHAALQGARICRPEGMFVGDLEAEGLVEPNVSLVTPATAEDCFRALMVGEVNIVTIDAPAAEEAIAVVPRAGRRVTELEGLATLQTLHAVAPRSSGAGRRAIERLNRGLTQMRGSGEWFSALQKHRAAMAAQQ